MHDKKNSKFELYIVSHARYIIDRLPDLDVKLVNLSIYEPRKKLIAVVIFFSRGNIHTNLQKHFELLRKVIRTLKLQMEKQICERRS